MDSFRLKIKNPLPRPQRPAGSGLHGSVGDARLCQTDALGYYGLWGEFSYCMELMFCVCSNRTSAAGRLRLLGARGDGLMGRTGIPVPESGICVSYYPCSYPGERVELVLVPASATEKGPLPAGPIYRSLLKSKQVKSNQIKSNQIKSNEDGLMVVLPRRNPATSSIQVGSRPASQTRQMRIAHSILVTRKSGHIQFQNSTVLRGATSISPAAPCFSSPTGTDGVSLSDITGVKERW